MGRLLVFFALADLAVLVVALIDCLSVPTAEIRALPRLLWVVIIVLFTPIGGVAWFVAGRPVGAAVPDEAISGHPAGSALRSTGSRAPDDDPAFLRSLDSGGLTAQEDAELLRMWEADLRRREEELRRDREQHRGEPDLPTDPR